jgi:hypothetical protein
LTLNRHKRNISPQYASALSHNDVLDFVIIRLDRRDLVWIDVTTNPTAEWVARQITEAFPWDEAPRYVIRDRDQIYGAVVTRRLRAMGIRDKPIAAASPWQNGFAERLIGSIRRECLDHLIVFGEQLISVSLVASLHGVTSGTDKDLVPGPCRALRPLCAVKRPRGGTQQRSLLFYLLSILDRIIYRAIPFELLKVELGASS